MKKLLLTASGIFLAASLYIGINSYKNINSGTNLLLANVEALAGGEIGGDCSGEYWICASELSWFESNYNQNCSGGDYTLHVFSGC